MYVSNVCVCVCVCMFVYMIKYSFIEQQQGHGKELLNEYEISFRGDEFGVLELDRCGSCSTL